MQGTIQAGKVIEPPRNEKSHRRWLFKDSDLFAGRVKEANSGGKRPKFYALLTTALS